MSGEERTLYNKCVMIEGVLNHCAVLPNGSENGYTPLQELQLATAYLLMQKMSAGKKKKERVLTDDDKKWQDSLKVGAECDARDSFGRWLYSQVSQIEDSRIQVLHFETMEYQWYAKHSIDIAELKTGLKIDEQIAKQSPDSLKQEDKANNRYKDRCDANKQHFFRFCVSFNDFSLSSSASSGNKKQKKEDGKTTTVTATSNPNPNDGKSHHAQTRAEKEADSSVFGAPFGDPALFPCEVGTQTFSKAPSEKEGGEKGGEGRGEDGKSSKRNKASSTGKAEKATGAACDADGDRQGSLEGWRAELSLTDMLEYYHGDMWEVAEVVAINEQRSHLRVRLVELGPSYDKVVNFRSDKIAKFGSHCFGAQAPTASTTKGPEKNSVQSLIDAMFGNPMTPPYKMIEEKQMTKEDREFRDKIEVGDFVDAIDQDGKWYSAIIKKIEYASGVEGKVSANDRLLIRFTEWQEKWNYWIAIAAAKECTPFASLAISSMSDTDEEAIFLAPRYSTAVKQAFTVSKPREEQDRLNGRAEVSPIDYSEVVTTRGRSCISTKPLPPKVTRDCGGRMLRFLESTGYLKEDYCLNVKRKDFWGGAVEIGILSNFFDVEVVSFDIQGPVVYQFQPLTAKNDDNDVDVKSGAREKAGPDEKIVHKLEGGSEAANASKKGGERKRVFFVFNGQHYDVLVYVNNKAKHVQEYFNAGDDVALDMARKHIELLHLSRYKKDFDSQVEWKGRVVGQNPASSTPEISVNLCRYRLGGSGGA
eukprot:jgi/Bigna1/90188/estExt_fgenesh1_pg.C_640085